MSLCGQCDERILGEVRLEGKSCAQAARFDWSRTGRDMPPAGREWARQGSVVVDCFSWWATERYTGSSTSLAEKTVLGVVLKEFEMYHAHLRLINQKPNYGWLQNMYHSLGQQVMRQGPQELRQLLAGPLTLADYSPSSTIEEQRYTQMASRL
jgi:hypothetical protein